MKIYLLCLGFCLLIAFPSQANSRPMDLVPRDHWTYPALQQLYRWGILGGLVPQSSIGRGPFTRYEIAVIVARIIDRCGYEPQFAPDSRIDAASVRDILAALLYEYRDEFMRLGMRDPMTTGQWEIEAYERAKEKNISLNASDWYFYSKNRPWMKDIVVPISSTPKMITPPQ